jgi:hypothetical protein
VLNGRLCQDAHFPVQLPLRVSLFIALSIAALAPIAYFRHTQVVHWREVTIGRIHRGDGTPDASS